MSVTTTPPGGGARVAVQKFGTFLSGMIMPGMMFVGSLTYVGIAVLGGSLMILRPAPVFVSPT